MIWATSGTFRYLVPLALLVVISFAIWVITKAFSGPLSAVPGPWHTRFTGIVTKYKILTGQRIFYVHELHQKYGPVVRVEPGEVVVSDLDAFREVHRIGSGFVKSDWYKSSTPGIEDNVFAMTDVQQHAARRRLLARPFSRSSLLANFQDLVSDRARLAVSKMKEEADRGDCDVMKWWTLMATDVIANVAFGDDSRLLEAGQKSSYIDDLELASMIFGLVGEVPWLYKMMRIAAPAFTRKCDTALQNVVTYGLSAASRARGKVSLSRHNIIKGLIDASRAEGATMTDFSLGSQASALIVAGSGTTAVTLTYAVWAILQHPDVRQKLEQEVSQLPDDYNDTALEKLPYLNAVITETLRLYGSAPGALPRTTPAKGIEVNGLYIPPGVTLTTQSYTMHRDPAVFNDPETYDPDRFYLKPLEGAQKYAFGPFGGGTRICLGIHLAQMELRHGLAEFFRECRHLELSEATTPASMRMENYFLISPISKRCMVKKCGNVKV
ncbi:uncharacterized protein Z519_05195 [Cladophialophora bantiana CBS 173.52]|uniref:Cytochrome P450 monooxygenase n=1 Tax=Cladophialophora bantiana (strain ATCC 10958 / CBS 173.52 / CDC B-1940 / NIH 8579) TaxID=1442370 RepID=A0A0D2HSM2_CLAB1|nr:uncharacterized protein Z519_05195 [Cladophialophora bantiana CBS 173.52]KIW93880.1 hypothetical protein Z519_05195 [Cladophialophora bantiana CBS 173.52]